METKIQRLPKVKNNERHSITAQRMKITGKQILEYSGRFGQISNLIKNYIYAVELPISDVSKREIGIEARRQILDNIDTAIRDLNKIKQGIL